MPQYLHPSVSTAICGFYIVDMFTQHYIMEVLCSRTGGKIQHYIYVLSLGLKTHNHNIDR